MKTYTIAAIQATASAGVVAAGLEALAAIAKT